MVLVIQILKKEYDKGKVHGLQKRLNDIPLELNELCRNILTRDNQRLPELVLCVQWLLYAARPLTREEFYFALLAGDDSEDFPLWDPHVADTAVISYWTPLKV